MRLAIFSIIVGIIHGIIMGIFLTDEDKRIAGHDALKAYASIGVTALSILIAVGTYLFFYWLSHG